MGGAQRLTQLTAGVGPKSHPTPGLRQFGVGPRRNFEKIVARRNGAKDLPARVVDEHHDRRETSLRRVRNLRTGHLKRTVTREHKGSTSSADLNSKGGRDRKAHRGIISLGEVQALAAEPQFEAPKEGIARFGDDVVARVAIEEFVDLEQHVIDAQRRAQSNVAPPQIVVIHDALPEARRALCRQRRHEVAQHHLRVGVERDIHPTRGCPHRALAPDLGLRCAEIHVGELSAEGENEIRLAHAVLNRARAERADVDPHVQRVIHRKDALGQHRGHNGNLKFLREASKFPFGARAK